MIVCFITILMGCSNSKTYTDRLNDERKAINSLINREGFSIISYPKDGVFAENEFAILPNGVYINVIDSGNGNRAIPGSTVILSRFSGDVLRVDKDTILYSFDTFAGNLYPLAFLYGTNRLLDSDDGYSNEIFSDGFRSALAHVGDSSIVKLIVPFRAGSITQSSGYMPIYFSRIRYTFEK